MLFRMVCKKKEGFLRCLGQASLELSAALIIVMLLLVATVKMFVWFNERMMLRQRDYEATRITAGQAPQDASQILDSVAILNKEHTQGVGVDESAYPAFNII